MREEIRLRSDRRDADLKGLGSTPHRHRSKFLMNFLCRKDGQFRSGGLLVGDRPFHLNPRKFEGFR